jgi:hypothetical protein
MSLAIEAPARTLSQRMEALKHANTVRVRRRQFKYDINIVKSDGGSATVLVAQLVADPPDWAMAWKVHDLLVNVPKIGRMRRDRIVTRLQISAGKTVAGLSPRQRTGLVTLLRSPDTTYAGRSFPS